jgi:hypothetical protein
MAINLREIDQRINSCHPISHHRINAGFIFPHGPKIGDHFNAITTTVGAPSTMDWPIDCRNNEAFLGN